MRLTHRWRRYSSRIISLMLIFCVGGAVYIGFQLLSFKMLPAADKAWEVTRRMAVQTPHVAHVTDEAVKPHRLVKIEPVELVAQRLSLPRGVLETMAMSYQPDANGMFKCLKSMERIPFKRVNDDFCDCDDMTDEPGTSACPESRFYCAYQHDRAKPTFVASSRVNDGICDCCDGSDEWLTVMLPEEIKVRGVASATLGIYQTPCDDRCDVLRAAKDADVRLRHQGAALKRKYLADAANLPAAEAKKYGPGGVFYHLSRSCYQLDMAAYRYTVCPFHNATQSKKSDSRVLGTVSAWLPWQPEAAYCIRLSAGSGYQCPQAKYREAIINFKCGLSDKLLSVREDDVCVYIFEMLTPAAC